MINTSIFEYAVIRFDCQTMDFYVFYFVRLMNIFDSIFNFIVLF